jgi:hypothetical protein
MAAVTIDASPATDTGSRGPGPARTAGPATADRSPATVRPGPTVRSWPLLVLAIPAAAEVWSGWVGIAQKTGFGLVSPLPGIWPSLHLDTAITLPIGVEAYAAYALRAWLARDRTIGERTRRFAKWSAICSLALGMAGQVAYHLLAQTGMTRAPWPITTVVSCLPVLVLAMGTALAHMLRADADADADADDTPDSRAGPPAVLRSLSWSPKDQGGPDRAAGPERSRAGTTTRLRDHGIWPAARRTTDGSGSHDRPEAGRNGQAGITASVAQRRSHGLQRGSERPGTHDQHRAGRLCRQRVKHPSVRRVSRFEDA